MGQTKREKRKTNGEKTGEELRKKGNERIFSMTCFMFLLSSLFSALFQEKEGTIDEYSELLQLTDKEVFDS